MTFISFARGLSWMCQSRDSNIVSIDQVGSISCFWYLFLLLANSSHYILEVFTFAGPSIDSIGSLQLFACDCIGEHRWSFSFSKCFPHNSIPTWTAISSAFSPWYSWAADCFLSTMCFCCCFFQRLFGISMDFWLRILCFWSQDCGP